MAIFSIQNGDVKKIPPIKIGLEKNIQKIFEENLNEILNITFLISEYSTSFGGRIDSLGIDNNGSPVIIEYKRNQNENVINQGLSYLRWLLDHKADFEALVQKEKIDIQIDWDSPRVICVAESYNKFDLDTADLLPINIELLKFRIYQNNVLLVEIETQQKVRISTSKVFNKGKQKKIIREKVKYTLKDHFSNISPKTKKIFETINEKIVALDESIIIEPKAKYIAYKLATNFVDIVVKQYGLKIFLNMPSGELNDPHDITRDLTKPKRIGHWGNGDYEVKLEKEEDIEKVFEFIHQSYVYNK
jgi:predicted transport protein